MKVLVTGATGMLGSAVAVQLLQSGHEVRTFQRGASGLSQVEDVRGSLTDPSSIARAVRGIDAIIHLAAKVSLSGRPADFEAINVQGTRDLLALSLTAGVTRCVFVSSPSVAHYGRSLVGVDALPADPARARGEYARSKARAEQVALQADSEDYAVVAVRPHSVWGPGDTQLIERIVERSRRKSLPLLGDGSALVDTTYVDNAASALIAALEQIASVRGKSYVVTNGEPRPVAELLARICQSAGVRPPRWRVPASLAAGVGVIAEKIWAARFCESEPPMTRFLAEQLSTAHWFDQRRTRAELRWQPTVSLEQGFENLRQWYRTL